VWRVLSDSGNAAGPVIVSAVASIATLAAGIVAVGSVGVLAAIGLGAFVPRYSPYARRPKRADSHDPAPQGDPAPAAPN
jgi:hypothetical protein